MEKHEALWEEVCQRIINSGLIPPPVYDTWLKPIYRVKFGERILYIWTPNNLVKNSVTERYVTIITDAAYRVTKKMYRLCILGYEENPPSEEELLRDEASYIKEDTKINESYTFENFIVGKSNRFAHAYALSVAETPGGQFNPLFLYGGSGLGKTHLCHAIVNFTRQFKPNTRVVYASAEKYTNDFIDSLREKRQNLFREKYRSADILIIDDIQFIAGKPSTIEEFFHTFNYLYENKKQIVLTSDRPANEISDIEERLISRFNWGLSCDITAPDYETRLAILQKKAQEDNINLGENIFSFLADNINSNIRDLEGALTKISAFMKINEDLFLDELKAAEILKNIMTPQKERNITYKMVVEAVSEYYHISTENLLGKSKRAEFTIPRQICMYLCAIKVPDATSVSIGKELKRDHSTVHHAFKKIDNDIKNSASVKSTIDDIISIIDKQ